MTDKIKVGTKLRFEGSRNTVLRTVGKEYEALEAPNQNNFVRLRADDGHTYTFAVNEFDIVSPVTVEQIRDYINMLGPNLPQRNTSEFALRVLDFIDNGPPKPTAEEVVNNCVDAWGINGTWRAKLAPLLLQELRGAGYLKEEA